LIYVLAAYSITIGTLAVYGVLMQYRGRVHASNLSASTGRRSSVEESGINFNLGAALLSPFWMWQHGMRAAGAVLFVLCLAVVPLYERELWLPVLFVAMVPLAAGVALGFVGDRIATNHRRQETPTEFAASQIPWAVSGVALFTVVLPWVWYFQFATAA
jgi:hypothetical protein